MAMNGGMQPNPVMRSNWNQPTMTQNPYSYGTQQLPMNVQPQMNRPPLYGRVVLNPEEITVQDVPTDGSAAFFPAADYSCIYARQWGNDGLIRPVKYVPEKTEEPSPVQNTDVLSVIMERLDSIEKILKRKPYKPNVQQNKSKQEKEVISDDANA